MATAGVAMHFCYLTLQQQSEKIRDDTEAAVLHAYRAQTALLQQKLTWQEYLAQRNRPVHQQLRWIALEGVEQQVRAETIALQQIFVRGSEVCHAICALVNDFSLAHDRAHTLYMETRAGHDGSASNMANELTSLDQKLSALILRIVDEAQAHRNKALQTLARRRVQSQVLVGTLAAIAAILSTLLMRWLLNRAISTPLQQAINAAHRILQGDYSQPLPTGRSDEVGRLVLALRSLQLHLKQSQSQITDLQKAINEHSIVSITDAKGRITYVNDEFCRSLGYSRKTLLGLNHRMIKSGVHPDAFFREMWGTLIAGRVWQGEICNRSKGGALLWMSTTIVPCLDDDNQPYQYVALRTDITAIRHEKEQLRRLDLAVKASQEVIYVTDAQLRIQYVNNAFIKKTGWSKAEILGQTPALLRSSQVSAATIAQMEHAIGCGEPWSGRVAIRHKPPKFEPVAISRLPEAFFWADMTVTPMLDNQGQTSGYVSILRDATHDVERERNLRIEAEAAALRAEASNLLQYPVSLRERFSQVIRKLFQITAPPDACHGGVYLRDRSTGELCQFLLEHVTDIRQPSYAALPLALLDQAVREPEVLVIDNCRCSRETFTSAPPHGHYVVPIVHASDVFGVMFLNDNAQPSRHPARLTLLKQLGEMMGLAVADQILQQQVLKARDAAIANARAKSEFLANMSHEIRTPLNGVVGMLELLGMTELNEKQRDFADTAMASVESLMEIINSVLDYSKIEAGKMAIEHIQIDLRRLVEDTASLLSEAAHRKGLELACFISPELPQQVYGDPTRIRQNLTNYLGNAIKFTDRGEVLVRVERYTKPGQNGTEPPPNLEEFIHFSVTDTGIGVDAATQEKLFEPFTQADGSTSRRFGGTGLGLVIVRSLTRLMGGEVGIESRPGKGSTFWFTVPLVAAESQLPQHDALPKLSGNILVVDDNATNRKVFANYLTAWDLQCSTASSAEQALQILRQPDRQFHALLLDYHMPAIDGLQLSNMLQNDPQLRSIPRILATSIGDACDEARAAGILVTLVKPIRQTLLHHALRDVLSPTPPSRPALALAVTPVQPHYPDKRVLLVEDNVTNRKVAAAMLERFGVRVEIAGDGQQAATTLMLGPRDLVLMDCQMPVMDGYHAAAVIRKWERDTGQPHTPIIALTANALEGDRDRCLAAGMDDYLSKPLTQTALGEKLQRWLANTTINWRTQSETEITPAVNIKIYSDLEKLMGADMADLVESFLTESTNLVAVIKHAIEHRDADVLLRSAHSLRSASAGIGGESLAAIACELERIGKASRPEQGAHWLERLDRQRNAVAAFLEARLSLLKQTAA